MIGVTKLLCDKAAPGDALRYRRASHDRKPIVVWNSTKACNLRCIHCYYTARAQPDPEELTTSEARAMILPSSSPMTGPGPRVPLRRMSHP